LGDGEGEILGVAWYGSDGQMQEFEDTFGLTFPTLRDDNGDIFAHFGVPAQPAWVFVSPDGTTERVLSELTPAEVRSRLDAMAT
jgi:peroxiredoxin